MVKQISIKDTPASRWVFEYRKRYGYMFYGSVVFIGLLILTSSAIGLAFIILGAYLMWRHYKHHKKDKSS